MSKKHNREFQRKKDLKIIDKNCSYDSYNTYFISDYENKIFHDTPVYNIYKICNIPLAYPEAERSLLKSDINFFKEKKEHQDKGLFYTNSDFVYMLYEESIKFDYRKKGREESDFRCKVDFKVKNKLIDYKKFLDKIHFERIQHDSSYLLVEYDFGSEDFLDKNKTNLQNLEPEIKDKESFIKTREKLLDKLGSNMIFEKKDFLKKKFGIILSEENDEINLQSLYNNDEGKTNSFNLEIEKEKFYRFVPMVCMRIPDLDASSDFAFFAFGQCKEITAKKNLLIRDKNSELFFVSKDYKKKVLDFEIDIFELEFYEKNSPNDVFNISDMETFCDVMIDKKNSVIFYLCYQKMRRIINQRVEKFFERKEKPLIFELDLNKKFDRKLAKQKFKIFLFIFSAAAMVCSFFLFFTLIISTGSAGLIIMGIVIIVFLVIIFFYLCFDLCGLMKNRRILNNGKIDLTDKKKLMENIQRIQILSNQTKNVFDKAEKEKKGKIVKVIIDLDSFKDNGFQKYSSGDIVKEIELDHKNVIDIHLSENSFLDPKKIMQLAEIKNPEANISLKGGRDVIIDNKVTKVI